MTAQTTHPDADVLAEFHAGLITGRRGARIAGHLAGCERCTALGGQLAEVSALLAAVPAPPMPQSVAHRLDTVLAAEAAKTIYPERPRGDGSPDTGPRHRRPGNRGFRPLALRVLAPAAAVLVLAAGGYGLSRLSSGPTSSQASSSSAGAAGAASRASAPRYSHAAAAPPAGQPGPTARMMSPQRGFTVVISDTDFSHRTLRQQLEGALSPQALQRSEQTRPTSQQAACVRQVAGNVRPRLVESARYEGRPATIIVLPERSGDIAWVTGAGCSVLDRTTLPPGI